jgi:hypothetical protein
MPNSQSHRSTNSHRSIGTTRSSLIAFLTILVFASTAISQDLPRPTVPTTDPVIPSDVFGIDDILTDMTTQALAPNSCVPGLGGRVYATGDFVQIVVLEPFPE